MEAIKTASSTCYSESSRTVKVPDIQQRLIPVHCFTLHTILRRTGCGPWQSDLHQGQPGCSRVLEAHSLLHNVSGDPKSQQGRSAVQRSLCINGSL